MVTSPNPRIIVLHETLTAFAAGSATARWQRLAFANIARWQAAAARAAGSSVAPVGCEVRVLKGDWGAVTQQLTRELGVVFAVLNMANECRILRSGPGRGESKHRWQWPCYLTFVAHAYSRYSLRDNSKDFLDDGDPSAATVLEADMPPDRPNGCDDGQARGEGGAGLEFGCVTDPIKSP